MTFNFARWNHVLIPTTKAGRDRFRASRTGRALRPIAWFFGALGDEGRVIAAAALVVGGFGIDVQSTEVYLLWSILGGLLIASLAMTPLHRLDGVRIEVEAPRRITLGDAVTFSVAVHNDAPGARDRHAVRLSGPFLPWDGAWIGPAPRLAEVRAGAVAIARMSARFASRGEHHLDPFSAAEAVPLGLAQGRSVTSAGVRFVVVPKIARVVRLHTPPGSRHQPGGVALASKTGESMDLIGVRPYRAGDPVRLVHARSWARTGTPVVREYQEEYFSRVGVVVDAATREPRQLEAILSLAAGVVAFLSRGEALIDLLVVGDRVHDLTLGRHLGFLEQALDLLACVEPDPARVDPARIVRRLAPHLAHLSCVVAIAPAWDGGELASRIRGAGVACTTLVVERPRASPPARPPSDASCRIVSTEAIERGEALTL